MKILIVTVLLISSSAWACKPASVFCTEKTATFDKKKIDRLEEMVENYQRLLTKFIVRPDNSTSCFNNHFASFFIYSLKEELKKGGKVCMDFRWKITSSVKYLVDPDSLENKSVPDEYRRAELKKLGDEIKAELKGI